MELLETISQNTAPKNSCYIVCRGNDSKLRTKFSPVLNSNGCEIAVVGLSTYYSYPNITDKNNLIEICDDKEIHHKYFYQKDVMRSEILTSISEIYLVGMKEKK